MKIETLEGQTGGPVHRGRRGEEETDDGLGQERGTTGRHTQRAIGDGVEIERDPGRSSRYK